MQVADNSVTIPLDLTTSAVEISCCGLQNLPVYRLSRDITLRAEEMEKTARLNDVYPMR